MTLCDSFFFTETRQTGFAHVLMSLGIVSDLWCLTFSRLRGHHLSVNAGTRRTPCAVVAGPRPITCRSPPVASVATPRSARESVRHPLTCFDNKTVLLFKALYVRVLLNPKWASKHAGATHLAFFSK